MKSSTRTALIVAVVLIIAGAVIIGGLLFTGTSLADLFSFSSGKMETNTWEITERFTCVSVTDTVSEIRIVPSETGACSVVCFEDVKMRHVAEVKNGTLAVRQQDERTWADHIGVNSQTPTVTVFLPEGLYDALQIRTTTGDVDVSEDFSFRTLRIEVDTADVVCLAGANETAAFITDTGDLRVERAMLQDVTMKTDTGHVTLDSVSLFGTLEIDSHTGRVDLTDTSCGDLEIVTTTGNVTLTRCRIDGKLDIETDTGDVLLSASDASEIEIDTDTGDVTGTLLTEKIFFVSSHTGKIDVPRGMTGGPCEIETDTGDVKISFAEQP
ncbi:MAG: DUF4097 family beta strand repeat protein [Oscillospiraceae bacterium]|nr:DUF4097 family beta strand repeat protein [Oscillospiraceae bacterium]